MTLVDGQKDQKRDGKDFDIEEKKVIEQYSLELAQFAMASSTGTGLSSSKKN